MELLSLLSQLEGFLIGKNSFALQTQLPNNSLNALDFNVDKNKIIIIFVLPS